VGLERGDQPGVEIAEVQVARLAVKLLGGEADQQPERVAVGGDRVWAGVALADEPLAEERLQRRRERAHEAPPWERSRRPAASWSSSGAASRY
jgi:hypothetical protein